MNKPDSIDRLPEPLQLRLLWDIDNLEYDPYEGSKAECIHDIINGSTSAANKSIISFYWKNLSDERLTRFVSDEIDSAQRTIDHLKKILYSEE